MNAQEEPPANGRAQTLSPLWSYKHNTIREGKIRFSRRVRVQFRSKLEVNGIGRWTDRRDCNRKEKTCMTPHSLVHATWQKKSKTRYGYTCYAKIGQCRICTCNVSDNVRTWWVLILRIHGYKQLDRFSIPIHWQCQTGNTSEEEHASNSRKLCSASKECTYPDLRVAWTTLVNSNVME